MLTMITRPAIAAEELFVGSLLVPAHELPMIEIEGEQVMMVRLARPGDRNWVGIVEEYREVGEIFDMIVFGQNLD